MESPSKRIVNPQEDPDLPKELQSQDWSQDNILVSKMQMQDNYPKLNKKQNDQRHLKALDFHPTQLHHGERHQHCHQPKKRGSKVKKEPRKEV